jgi:hypothetical protein
VTFCLRAEALRQISSQYRSNRADIRPGTLAIERKSL